MRRRVHDGAACAIVALALASAVGVGAQSHKHYSDTPEAAQPAPGGQIAPRLKNLGPHTFPVTTKSKLAQTFVNQGMNLSYGFNHAEAGRSFREAARLDPECAMAYWGQALVLGPNINAPMDAKNEPVAFDLVQRAIALHGNASAREQAYIDALAKRYSGKADDRAARDKAYSDAGVQLTVPFAPSLMQGATRRRARFRSLMRHEPRPNPRSQLSVDAEAGLCSPTKVASYAKTSP